MTLKSEQYTAVQNNRVNAPSGKHSGLYSFVMISDRIGLFVLLYEVWPTTRLDRLAIWYLDNSPRAAPAVLEFYKIDHFENRIIAIGVSNLIKNEELSFFPVLFNQLS